MTEQIAKNIDRSSILTTTINTKPHQLLLDKPIVMGVLNVTPDSFFDGGKYNSVDAALFRAEQMIAEGVDIIDVGGESTRPTADLVELDQELSRVIPVIEKITHNFSIPISIDTSKATVMQEAVRAGASLINDVRALQEPGTLDAAVALQVPVCIMHMQNNPQTMQHEPNYNSVVHEVINFLSNRASECIAAGISRENIIIDPGFCFGKKLEHSLTILKQLKEFNSLNFPLLVGISNKSMTALSTIESKKSKLGRIDNNELSGRHNNSIAGNVIAYMQGANIFRTHNVLATVQSLNFVRQVCYN